MALDNNQAEEDTHFAKNLRFLCSKQKSVSEICRQLGINRPQFGRYLHGKARPNAYNIRLICDYFSVTTETLDLPHHDFVAAQTIQPAIPSSQSEKLFSFARNFGAPPSAIKRYEGDYLVYHTSRTLQNAVFSAYYRLSMRGAEMHIKTIYRGRHPVLGGTYIMKHVGQVFFDRGQLFIVKGTLPANLPISFDIVDVSSFGIVKYMHGTLMGKKIGSQSIRTKKTVWSFLGKSPQIREGLAQCGVFRHNSTRIDPNVRKILAETE